MLTKYFLTRFQPHIIGVVATSGSAHTYLLGNFYCHGGHDEENVEKEEEAGDVELLTVIVQMVSPL